MKKLIIALSILAVIAAALFGYLLYQTSHVFIEDAVYSKRAEELDLRGSDISQMHYETLRAQVPDSRILWDVPLSGGTYASNSTALKIRDFKESDMSMMGYFTDLKTMEITDCADYVLLGKLQALIPDTTVTYGVDLGGSKTDSAAKSLELNPGSYGFEQLMENLQYVPNLEKVIFYQTELDSENYNALQEAYPEIAFDYTVELLGEELTAQTKEVDLSKMTSGDVDKVAAKLPMLAALETVKLAPGTSEKGLTLEEVAKLKKAAPQIKLQYSFELYGESFTTDDTEMLFKNKRKQINDTTLPQLYHALDIMNNCTRVVLDNTAASNAAVAQMREDYRGKTEVVWRVYFANNGSSLTDVEVLRVVYDLVDDNCSSLKYLEKVRFMDIGHNEYLDGCDFVAGMPELEVAIISGAPIKSLEPFANCKKLKFLEMSNCSYIPDLEPLRNCTELEMLNIGHTSISDLSPLDDLKLTHLCTKVNKVSEEERERFVELHPDCWTTYLGDNDYSVGWRYDEDDNKLEWYAKLAEAFRYPKAPNHTGWYLKK